MRFEDVADLLPGLVDGTVRVDAATQAFIESDLRCQAELARYRKLLRTLEQLRTRYFEPSPGLLAATLTALAEEGERRVVHSIITGKRLAVAGAALNRFAAPAWSAARARQPALQLDSSLAAAGTGAEAAAGAGSSTISAASASSSAAFGSSSMDAAASSASVSVAGVVEVEITTLQ